MTDELFKLEPMPPSTPVEAPTPMGLLQMAIQGNATMDTIERLVALQERAMAQDALREFNAAMNRAQTQMGRIARDMDNKQTSSKYASYAAIDREIRPIYTKEGLALSFDTADALIPEYVRITCAVSHSAGHTQVYHIDMPADGKGAKGGDVMTKTHATGAASAYGRRYLVMMIFNLAVGEGDTDGNEFGLDEDIFQGHLKAMRLAKDIPTLQKKYEEAKAAAKKDKVTLASIVKVKDECKGKLRGAE